MGLERLRKYSGIVVILAGLTGIYFYVRKKSPGEATVEFVLKNAILTSCVIKIEYCPVGINEEENLYRKIEKFSQKPYLTRIIDDPVLPEGNYTINITFVTQAFEKTFKRIYKHKVGGTTRFVLEL